MRVTATGEETALAHIIAAVQRAQSSRANIQRLATASATSSCRSWCRWRWPPGFGGDLRRIRRGTSTRGWRGSCGPRIRRQAAGRGVHHCGGSPDHCLSLRDGIGHAGGHHGRVECRGAARHSDPRRRGVGESRRDGRRVRQNRHADGGQTGGGQGMGRGEIRTDIRNPKESSSQAEIRSAAPGGVRCGAGIGPR